MDGLGTFRRPAHTGVNRCWPCTAVNAVLVLAVAILAGAFAPVLGGLVLAVGVLAIVFRGYVVPYTPRFAPRVVAAIPGADRLFPDHGPARTPGGIGSEAPPGEPLLAALFEAGVLAGGDDLALTDDFAASWDDAMASLADADVETLAGAVADATPGAASTRTYTDGDDEWVILEAPDGGATTWLSRPVAIADATAVRSLVAAGLDPEVAADAAGPLRLFLDSCPACGAALVETTPEECCGSVVDGPDHVLACPDCDQRLATLD